MRVENEVGPTAEPAFAQSAGTAAARVVASDRSAAVVTVAVAKAARKRWSKWRPLLYAPQVATL